MKLVSKFVKMDLTPLNKFLNQYKEKKNFDRTITYYQGSNIHTNSYMFLVSRPKSGLTKYLPESQNFQQNGIDIYGIVSK